MEEVESHFDKPSETLLPVLPGSSLVVLKFKCLQMEHRILTLGLIANGFTIWRKKALKGL